MASTSEALLAIETLQDFDCEIIPLQYVTGPLAPAQCQTNASPMPTCGNRKLNKSNNLGIPVPRMPSMPAKWQRNLIGRQKCRLILGCIIRCAGI